MAETVGEQRRVFAFLDVSNPLVAWLVYRGGMVSAGTVDESAISIWLTRYLEAVAARSPGVTRFKAELALEAVRQSAFPDAVSRLCGFYAFPDEGTALRAGEAWNPRKFRPEHLAEIGLEPGAVVSRYDAEWLRDLDAANDSTWEHDYFAGEPRGVDPIWELLVEGRGLVFGTDVRERAYETVARLWPASLPLLEMARVATVLDSDLGLIAAFATEDENGVSVTYRLSMADATDEDFLARFGSFEGPKNTADLTPESDLVVPDLRRGFFLLEPDSVGR